MTANVLYLCDSLGIYLGVLITQGAATEAQKRLKDALLITQVIAVPITYAFLQHT